MQPVCEWAEPRRPLPDSLGRIGSDLNLSAPGVRLPGFSCAWGGIPLGGAAVLGSCSPCPSAAGAAAPLQECGKRGPQDCESPLPCDQDSFADLIPAATPNVGRIVRRKHPPGA